MVDESIISKIRKCLALGRSSNEHEAAAALAKARALMDEHGVSEAQLAMAEVEESTARASRTRKPPIWENYLCRTVERALGVASFIASNGDRTFVGRGPAPEIAAYAFAVLFRRLKSARADYVAAQLKRCRPGRKRQRADIFSQGWASAVYRKIEELMPECEPDTLVDQYLAERYPNLVSVEARRADAKGRAMWNDFSRGHSAGQSVDLNRGVGGSAPVLLLA